MRRLVLALVLVAALALSACSARVTQPTEVTYNSAKLNAQVHVDAGDTGHWRFVLKDVQSGGSSAPWVGVNQFEPFPNATSRIPASGTVEVSRTATGLKSGHTYQVGWQWRREDGSIYTVGSTTNDPNGPYPSLTTAPFPASVAPADAGALHAKCGTNLRAAYHGTGNAHPYYAQIKEALNYLDCRTIRDGLWPNYDLQRAFYEQLGAEGKFKGNLNICDMQEWRDAIERCNQKFTDIANSPNLRAYIANYQGPNEVNVDGRHRSDGRGPMIPYLNPDGSCPGTCDWKEALRQYTAYVNGKLDAMPTERDKPRLAPSYTSSADAQSLGELPGTDLGTAHPYPGANPNPLESITHGLNDYCRWTAPSKGCVFTEVGYHGDETVGGHDGLPPRERARATLRYALEAYRNGVRRIDWFTSMGFETPKTPCPDENNGGLDFDDWSWFDCNFQPKPVAVAMHNLQATLGAGNRTSPTPVKFRGADEATYGGGTTRLRRTVVQTADGTSLVILWRDVAGWDRPAKQEIPIAPVAVDFEVPVGTTVKVVRPVDSATEQELPQAGTVNVGRDPVILTIRE